MSVWHPLLSCLKGGIHYLTWMIAISSHLVFLFQVDLPHSYQRDHPKKQISSCPFLVQSRHWLPAKYWIKSKHLPWKARSFTSLPQSPCSFTNRTYIACSSAFILPLSLSTPKLLKSLHLCTAASDDLLLSLVHSFWPFVTQLKYLLLYKAILVSPGNVIYF